MIQEVQFEQSPCPLCEGLSGYVLHADLTDVRYGGVGRFSILKCRGCDLARLSPRPDRATIHQFYDSRYAPYQDHAGYHSGISGMVRRVLSVPYRLRYGSLAQTWSPSANAVSLLDIGCSSGEFIEQMRELGWDVWGIEMDRDAAARAALRAPAPERIFVGSALDADYPDATFDAVTASHLLEHLHDPAQLLARVHRWLRPDGQLRIWVPDILSLESRLFGRHWSALDVPRHLYHFEYDTLAALLRNSEFEVISARPQFQGSSFAGSLSNICAGRLGRDVTPGAGVLYRMAAPIGWLLCGLGNRAYIEVVCKRQ